MSLARTIDPEVAVQIEDDTATIACSLEQEGMAERRARWQALAARAGAEIAPTARGLQVSFRRDEGVAEEIESLVALERACCSWADWSVRPEGERVMLEVGGAGAEAVSALRQMFGHLSSASQASSPVNPTAEASTRGRAVTLAALGIACLACVVPLLLAVVAGGSAAGALGGREGLFVGVVLSVAVLTVATYLFRRRKRAVGARRKVGCGC